MEMNMYDKMQQLQFLQGLNFSDFNDILTSISLDFNTYNEGDVIVHQGDICDKLIYILDGTFEVEYRDNEQSIMICETSNANPYLIEPYNMYSIKRRYERSYIFKTKGSTFTISKNVFNTKLLQHKIIRSNLINYLSNQITKEHSKAFFNLPLNIEKRIVAFINSFCLFPTGEKTIHIKMETLAEIIDETRLNVSKVLNKWDAHKLIEMKRLTFYIPEFSRLNEL